MLITFYLLALSTMFLRALGRALSVWLLWQGWPIAGDAPRLPAYAIAVQGAPPRVREGGDPVTTAAVELGWEELLEVRLQPATRVPGSVRAAAWSRGASGPWVKWSIEPHALPGGTVVVHLPLREVAALSAGENEVRFVVSPASAPAEDPPPGSRALRLRLTMPRP